MDMTPIATMDQSTDFENANHNSYQNTVSMTSKASIKNAGEKIAAELEVFTRVAQEVCGKLDANADFESRCRQAVNCAAELVGVAPTWTAFYREVLGGTGVVRKLFPTSEEYVAFEATEAHDQVFEALTALRSRDLPENDPTEQQRMITIRLPLTLHKAICDEANELQVSVNKLCISRMLQPLDGRMIPNCKNKRRGRRPGAQPLSKAASELGQTA